MPAPSIPLKEYAARRQQLLRRLDGAVGLVFAGDVSSHLPGPWRPHPNFEYLTGIVDEPGAALLLEPRNPNPARRAVLLLRPLNPEVEKWDGYRGEISAALKKKYGFETIHRMDSLPRWLRLAAIRSKRLALLHPPAMHTQPVTPDLEIFRKVVERIPGVSIVDQSDLLALLRAKKSPAEIAMIRHAASITARGFEAALNTLRPGITEFDVQEAIEHAYKSHGSRGVGYGTIAGAGLNSTVLHYHANNQPLADGDLICIDSAASYGGYTADVTRTYPVNGRFTKRQRAIYDIVLKANLAAIARTKAGATIAQIDKAARDVITRAGYGDFFIHGIGHHVGLEVHDLTPVLDERLPEGAVITIEPGIYIPDERIGVRIEDDVVATRSGPKVLTSGIIKRADDIEKVMARTRSRR